jgi:epoxide hydrolase-like predicted phosphatase
MITYIFDLGNVLFEADMSIVEQEWHKLSGCPVPIIRQDIIDHDIHFEFERSSVTEKRFFKHVRSVLEIADETVDLVTPWNSIYGDVFRENAQAINILSKQGKVIAFTNTNQTHAGIWPHLYRSVLAVFSHIYQSHEIGYRKPDPEAFQYVLDDMRVPPEQAVFFDDRIENVAAARSLGIEGVLVDSAAAVSLWFRSCENPPNTRYNGRATLGATRGLKPG